jgi:hypothetical protein
MPPVRGACFVVAGGESSWSSGRHWARNICVGRSRHFHMLVFMFIFTVCSRVIIYLPVFCTAYGDPVWSIRAFSKAWLLGPTQRSDLGS